MSSLLSFDNEVFSNYIFYSGVVGLKMMAMSGWTSKRRLSHKIFANPEDVPARIRDQVRPTLEDERVERIRRNHLNDLENIPVFVLAGLMYVLTNPSQKVALWHFRLFAISRLLHTVSYQSGLQPWRGVCFIVGTGVTLSMIVQVMRHGGKF